MSSDFISRSALLQSLRNNVLVDVTTNLEKAIKERPTAHDVDKVVEKIKEIMKDESIRFVDQAVNRSVNIVKSGGIE